MNKKTNLAVHLAILDDGDVVYIEKRKANRPIRMYSAVGKRAPAHCTGLGKVLLAHLSEESCGGLWSRKGCAVTRRVPSSPG